MRILFVNTVGDLGGAERSLCELTAALARRDDLDIHVCAPAGALGKALAEADAEFHPIPACRLRGPRHGLAFLRAAGTFAAAARALSRRTEELRPDILHANGLTAVLIAPRRRNAASDPARIWHCRDLPKPDRAHRFAAARVDRIVAISPRVEQQWIALATRRPAPPLVRIDNGIDLQRFASLPGRTIARARLGLPRNARLIGMAAQLVPWKRHDLFLDAFAAVLRNNPSAHAAIAGSDRFGEHRALRKRLRRQSARLGLDKRVAWLGEVHDMPAFLAALDVLVHPPPDEPFGRIVCEAMAAGCPAIVSPGGGPAAILEHGKTGIIARAPTPPALAREILALLDDTAAAGRLAAAARERVRKAFDIRRTADRVAELYRDIARSVG